MGKQQNQIYFENSKKKITELGLEKSSAQLIKENSIVYSSRAPIGHINIVKERYATNQGCKSITPILIDTIFLYWLLKNRTNEIQERASGTTFKEISAKGFGETIIAIPPKLEQIRIAKEIDFYIHQIEVYEDAYNKLQKLNQEFPEKLRQSILQYAMQGKLVKQDPNDDSVDDLLDQIRAEKQRLYKEGKLKKKDLEENIIYQGDDNSYYENIPENWKLSQLGRVSFLYTGNSINKKTKEQYFTDVTGTDYIATKDVNFDRTINYSNGINIPENHIDNFKIAPAKSILLCLEGGSAGKKIGQLSCDVCFGNKLCCVNSYIGLNEFMFYFLQSPQFLRDFEEKKTGIIGGVSIGRLKEIIFPLVPINEQNKIVILLNLVDQQIQKFYEF